MPSYKLVCKLHNKEEEWSAIMTDRLCTAMKWWNTRINQAKANKIGSTHSFYVDNTLTLQIKERRIAHGT